MCGTGGPGAGGGDSVGHKKGLGAGFLRCR